MAALKNANVSVEIIVIPCESHGYLKNIKSFKEVQTLLGAPCEPKRISGGPPKTQAYINDDGYWLGLSRNLNFPGNVVGPVVLITNSEAKKLIS
jgi:hypothetical protein